jgi:hypothetical protein
MSRPSVTVTTNADGVGRHRVEVDGHDISKAVSKATLWLSGGEPPELDLELRVFESQRIEAAEAEITIPAETHDALVALGWTPPAVKAQAAEA